ETWRSNKLQEQIGLVKALGKMVILPCVLASPATPPVMIDLLLKLAQSIFGLRKDFQQADIARRGRAADFLSAIAEAIELTGAQLRQGRYPAGSCQQLLVFSDEMPGVLGDIIGVQ